MRYVNVFVADGDPQCLKRNMEELGRMEGIRIVGGTMDGDELIRRVKSTNVDVVLTELTLKKVDGLGVLAAIGSMRGKRPKMLVLSRMSCDRMIDAALSLGASYYMLKPAQCGLIYQRIRLLAEENSGEEEADTALDSVRVAAARCMREMGFSPALKGSRYILEAVTLCAQDKSRLRYLTGRLYPEIAVMFSTTALSVERAMRTCINAAWKSGGFERYALSTGDGAFSERRPSAGQLIEKLFMIQNKRLN